MSSLNPEDPTKPTASQNEDSKDNHLTDEKVDAQRANELQSEPTSLGRVHNENNDNDDKSRGEQKKNTEKETAGQEQPLAMMLGEKTELRAQSKMKQNGRMFMAFMCIDFPGAYYVQPSRRIGRDGIAQ